MAECQRHRHSRKKLVKLRDSQLADRWELGEHRQKVFGKVAAVGVEEQLTPIAFGVAHARDGFHHSFDFTHERTFVPAEG